MCSFSISEPVTTVKTTYVSCQSKSPKNHRWNFLSRLSILLTILFFCVAVVFRCRSPQNHRWFLCKILGRWFFGFAHRKTIKILFMGNFGWVVFRFRSPQNHRYYSLENLGLVFSLELSRRPFCDFKRYKNISLFQCIRLQ